MSISKKYKIKRKDRPITKLERLKIVNKLMEVSESRQKDWQEVVENLDFCKDSFKSWFLLKEDKWRENTTKQFHPSNRSPSCSPTTSIWKK